MKLIFLYAPCFAYLLASITSHAMEKQTPQPQSEIKKKASLTMTQLQKKDDKQQKQQQQQKKPIPHVQATTTPKYYHKDCTLYRSTHAYLYAPDSQKQGSQAASVTCSLQ